jgi:hypothetical protein
LNLALAYCARDLHYTVPLLAQSAVVLAALCLDAWLLVRWAGRREGGGDV